MGSIVSSIRENAKAVGEFVQSEKKEILLTTASVVAFATLGYWSKTFCDLKGMKGYANLAASLLTAGIGMLRGGQAYRALNEDKFAVAGLRAIQSIFICASAPGFLTREQSQFLLEHHWEIQYFFSQL